MRTPSLIDKAFLLKKTQLFGSLDLDLLLAVADKATLSQFESGDEIFAIGNDGNRMYLITKGSVQVLDSQRRVMASLAPGDFFGDESLFNDKPRAYYAVSTGNTQLLALSRSHLLSIISECPSVALGLLQVYTASLQFRPREVREDVP